MDEVPAADGIPTLLAYEPARFRSRLICPRILAGNPAGESITGKLAGPGDVKGKGRIQSPRALDIARTTFGPRGG